MRRFDLLVATLVLFISSVFLSCKPKVTSPGDSSRSTVLHGIINQRSPVSFDSTLIPAFYNSYPELKKYEKDVTAIYRKYNFHEIWFEQNGMVEFGHALFSKVKDLELEGVLVSFPYQAKIDGVFIEEIENTLTESETELMMSNLFLFYTEKVYKGIDDKTSTSMGWLLPRKQVSYTGLLDSMMNGKKLQSDNGEKQLRQYYRLREVLRQYREIEQNGGWKHIDFNPKLKAYKPGDTAQVILQIRERLFITGDLTQNNQSKLFDSELLVAVKKYQARNGFNPVSSIIPKHIQSMNIPVEERIKQLVVNMERCRWISPDITKAKELVVVNIPSYKLNFYRDGKSVLESAVVVGKSMNKTVIFSGKMSNIVFSPYWNVPQSILNKEIKPGIAKNPNYLEIHNMEWYKGQVRQKPGKKNSLGLVKFIFPNTNDIYLHDTPSKNLFERETRAFSHGCIRVAKPRELALAILQNDSTWTPQKVDAAMNAGVEKWVTLKYKIPVYIGYFTAWVNEKGEISFYDDLYKMDNNLLTLMTDSQ